MLISVSLTIWAFPDAQKLDFSRGRLPCESDLEPAVSAEQIDILVAEGRTDELERLIQDSEA